MRILIVEDELILAADLEDQLTNLGHQVIGIAESPEDAIRMANQQSPDLITMDFQLQGEMSGGELATILQRLTGARIIYITAFPDALLRNRDGNTPGICIQKPFTLRQIAAAVSGAIRRSPVANDHSSG
jgi:DNA-binding response OmpR family regulator